MIAEEVFRRVVDALEHAGILRIRSSELDRAHLHRWIPQLHLQEQWEAACRAAGVAA